MSWYLGGAFPWTFGVPGVGSGRFRDLEWNTCSSPGIICTPELLCDRGVLVESAGRVVKILSACDGGCHQHSYAFRRNCTDKFARF